MSIGRVRGALMALCGAVVLLLGETAHAGAVTRDGFAFPSEGDVRIVVFRPDVHVGSLGVGGVDTPNADWTQAARTNIQQAMEAAGEARSSNMSFLPDMEGDHGRLVDDYRGLFKSVSSALFQHVTPLADRLPNRLMPAANPKAPKRYRFDWSLGGEASRLRDITGGDYAMFVYTYDSYGDAGRKVAQLLMAGLFGSYIPAGVHIGYAGLVDLRTGDVVWFNTDIQMGGDPREADGAVKRVGQLLRGFPARAAGAAPAAVQ